MQSAPAQADCVNVRGLTEYSREGRPPSAASLALDTLAEAPWSIRGNADFNSSGIDLIAER